MKWPRPNAPRVLLLAALALLYLAILVATGGLGFAPVRDEVHFWPTALRFADGWPPSPELLRDYGELSTPLPFVLFGWMEHAFGRGIAAGRAVNLALSVVLLLIVGWPRDGERWRPLLAAAGLLGFPYFLGTATHLYTDMLAAALAAGGLWAHARGRRVIAAVLFVLAISSRQYTVAFPLALAGHELWRARRRPFGPPWRWFEPLVAAISLAGWYAFFGGPGPPAEVARQGIATTDAWTVYPQYGLYFLACVGFWFVLPEWLLLRRSWPPVVLDRRAGLLAVAVLLLCLFFPPLGNLGGYPIATMGYLDKAVRLAVPDLPRLLLYAGLAWLALARLLRPGRAGWLLVAHALLLTKAQIAWDKYALPLLVSYWLLAARGLLDDEGATASGSAPGSDRPVDRGESAR